MIAALQTAIANELSLNEPDLGEERCQYLAACIVLRVRRDLIDGMDELRHVPPFAPTTPYTVNLRRGETATEAMLRIGKVDPDRYPNGVLFIPWEVHSG